jgi:hypothetical protein
LHFVIFLYSFLAVATPFSLKTLTDYADRNGYTDNRRTVKADRMYGATRSMSNDAPYTMVNAFAGPDSFKQLSLWCRECRMTKASDKLIQACRGELALLYKHVSGTDAPVNLLEQIKEIQSETKTASDPNFKIKLSSGFLKCDGLGGVQLRVDLFYK